MLDSHRVETIAGRVAAPDRLLDVRREALALALPTASHKASGPRCSADSTAHRRTSREPDHSVSGPGQLRALGKIQASRAPAHGHSAASRRLAEGAKAERPASAHSAPSRSSISKSRFDRGRQPVAKDRRFHPSRCQALPSGRASIAARHQNVRPVSRSWKQVLRSGARGLSLRGNSVPPGGGLKSARSARRRADRNQEPRNGARVMARLQRDAKAREEAALSGLLLHKTGHPAVEDRLANQVLGDHERVRSQPLAAGPLPEAQGARAGMVRKAAVPPPAGRSAAASADPDRVRSRGQEVAASVAVPVPVVHGPADPEKGDLHNRRGTRILTPIRVPRISMA